MIATAWAQWGMKASDAGPRHGSIECSVDIPELPHQVSGKLPLTITLESYDNPGQIGGSVEGIDIRGFTWNFIPGREQHDFNLGGLSFPKIQLPAEGEWQETFEVVVDTTKYPYDGLHQLRVAPIVRYSDTPYLDEMRAILRWQIDIHNGKTRKSYQPERSGIECVGFYVPTGYATAALRNASLLYEPLSAPIVLQVETEADSCQRCVDQGHPSKAPITRTVRYVDDIQHFAFPGPFKGDMTLAPTNPDMLLAPGEHELRLRAVQPDTILGSTNQGELRLPFTVAA